MQRSLTTSAGWRLALVASSVLVVAGCGGSGSNGEAAKPAAQVLADTKTALFNAKAVHVAGTMTAGGTAEQLDLQLQGQDTAGTLTVAGQKIQIVKTGGSLYLNAPAAFWSKTTGTSGTALANKWIVVTGAQDPNISQLTLQGIAASLNTNDSPLAAGTGRATVAGQKAIVLTQKDGSQLFVADSASPLPLKVVNRGTGQGTINFTGYGKQQKIEAPAGAVTPQQAAGTATSA